jgi:hypothetical protein
MIPVVPPQSNRREPWDYETRWPLTATNPTGRYVVRREGCNCVRKRNPLEKRLECLFNGVGVFKPNDLLAKNALAVVDYRCRQAFDSAKRLLHFI